MQFSAQKNRLAHPFWELAPNYPQENPGFATVNDIMNVIVNDEKGHNICERQLCS